MEKYYLGIRKADNKKVYLIAPSWDCGWYWGFGYIQTFSRCDIYSHEHFDNLFLKNNIFDSFKEYFKETPLNNNEIWELLGYMKEFYVAREYAELLRHGNYLTERAKCFIDEKNKKENENEIKRINKIILPELFEKIKKLLKKEN